MINIFAWFKSLYGSSKAEARFSFDVYEMAIRNAKDMRALNTITDELDLHPNNPLNKLLNQEAQNAALDRWSALEKERSALEKERSALEKERAVFLKQVEFIGKKGTPKNFAHGWKAWRFLHDQEKPRVLEKLTALEARIAALEAEKSAAWKKYDEIRQKNQNVLRATTLDTLRAACVAIEKPLAEDAAQSQYEECFTLNPAIEQKKVEFRERFNLEYEITHLMIASEADPGKKISAIKAFRDYIKNYTATEGQALYKRYLELSKLLGKYLKKYENDAGIRQICVNTQRDLWSIYFNAMQKKYDYPTLLTSIPIPALDKLIDAGLINKAAIFENKELDIIKLHHALLTFMEKNPGTAKNHQDEILEISNHYFERGSLLDTSIVLEFSSQNTSAGMKVFFDILRERIAPVAHLIHEIATIRNQIANLSRQIIKLKYGESNEIKTLSAEEQGQIKGLETEKERLGGLLPDKKETLNKINLAFYNTDSMKKVILSALIEALKSETLDKKDIAALYNFLKPTAIASDDKPLALMQQFLHDAIHTKTKYGSFYSTKVSTGTWDKMLILLKNKAAILEVTQAQVEMPPAATQAAQACEPTTDEESINELIDSERYELTPSLFPSDPTKAKVSWYFPTTTRQKITERAEATYFEEKITKIACAL